jgi:hypothetical protein
MSDYVLELRCETCKQVIDKDHLGHCAVRKSGSCLPFMRWEKAVTARQERLL